MSYRRRKWDEGDPECLHPAYVQYCGHIYCLECMGWIGPTISKWNHEEERASEPWDYTEVYRGVRWGVRAPRWEDIPLWSDSDMRAGDF